jgi:hypothetical protein
MNVRNMLTINGDGLYDARQYDITRIARRCRLLIDGEVIYFADDLLM